MNLVADRFLLRGREAALDLATGRVVTLRLCARAGYASEMAWARRCATLFEIWHPHLVPLVDFGAVARTQCFEAWCCPPSAGRWPVDDQVSAFALGSAVAFLRDCGLVAPRPMRRIAFEGRPALIPFAGNLREAGERARAKAPPSVARRPSCIPGLVLQPRPVTRQVVEMLETGQNGEPRCVQLEAAEGDGVETVLREIAREARLRGFVPLSTAVFAGGGGGEAWLDLLAKRHLLVIHREPRTVAPVTSLNRRLAGDNRSPLVRLLLRLGAASTRPHLVLVVRSAPSAGHASIELAPLSEERLRKSVVIPGVSGERIQRVVREAAAACDGQPGVLIRLLQQRLGGGRWPWASEPRPADCARRVAESADVYRVSDQGASCTGSADRAVLARIRCRRDEGLRLAGEGRHAAAERALRDALGALVRRRDHAAAGRAAVALGRLLRERGRHEAAAGLFEQARDLLQQGGADREAIGASICTAQVWTDAGRLRKAEAALHAARIAAREVGDPAALVASEVGLARALFWQGRFDEARRLAEGCLGSSSYADAGAMARQRGGASDGQAATSVHERLGGVVVSISSARSQSAIGHDGVPFEGDTGVSALCLAARAALACHQVTAAGAHARRALEHARDTGASLELWAAHRAMAALHAQTGDLDALGAHVSDGLSAARQAHAPLAALRLRLVLVNGLRHAGKLERAREVAAGLARLEPDRLPALLGARVRLAVAAARCTGAGGQDALTAARTLAARIGAGVVAEQLCDNDATALTGRLDVVREVVELLRLCHDADDEVTALGEVCARIRRQTRAASVAILGAAAESAMELASAGCRPAPLAVAQRAIDAGLPIVPFRSSGGTEAAAPVRSGGAAIAALGCRWPADVAIDPEQVMGLLDTAAAAAASCVRVALDRRLVPVDGSPEGDLTLIGASHAIEEVRRAIARAAAAPFPVLIEGESGSGKELVARAIHAGGPRRARKFCALNCAALSDELVEAELFGHARGAFTGAVAERQGLFEEASGGTLFLDEVEELSPRAQAKLLRVIQECEVRRIGENFARSIDARIVAAANRPLRAEAEAGRFRRDLLYRLDVIRIVVPPLRDRVGDLAVLAAHFWQRAAGRTGSRATLAPATLAALARYDWPGNVRELQNVLAALVVTAPRRGSIGPSQLPPAISQPAPVAPRSTLDEARRTFERQFVEAALARTGGHKGRAARELGLSRQGLAKLLARLRQA
jgi:DNA-binding NtrC family response regulator/tetratricopeptide (TPR) repeat protein